MPTSTQPLTEQASTLQPKHVDNKIATIGELKQLVANPHFKFGTSCETNSTSENQGLNRANDDRSISAPQLDVNQNVPPRSTSQLRLDHQHRTLPRPHLPPSVLEQFVGWSEQIVSTWEEPIGKVKSQDSRTASISEGKSVELLPTSRKQEWPNSKDATFRLESEIHRGIVQFDDTVGYGNALPARDTLGNQVGVGQPDKNVRSELPVVSNTPYSAETFSEEALLLKRAFAAGIQRSSNLQSVLDHRGNDTTEKNIELAVNVPALSTVQKSSRARFSRIVEIDRRNWPEITDKLLGPGRSMLERLGNAVRQGQTETSCETIVAGESRGVGVTTISLALARWFAEQGERVLLVDADIHSAGLTRVLGLTDNRSWVTVASNRELFENSLIRMAGSAIAFATISPLRIRTIWPSFIFDQLATLLGSACEVFDRVLVDCGTVAQLQSELSGNRTLASGAVLVTGREDWQGSQVARLRSNLSGIGIDHLVFAQNFSRKS